MSSRLRNLKITTELLPSNLDGVSILDCGHGYGVLGFLIKSRMSGTPYLEGFDIFKPYVEKLKELDLYDKVYEMDIRDAHKLEKKFDYVFALEVLEHLKYGEAIATLLSLEKMCKKMIVVSMPIGPHTQGVTDGNIFQVHRSRHYPREFEAMGYETISIPRLTKILSVVDRIRCLLLGLKYKRGNFVAWKKISAS